MQVRTFTGTSTSEIMARIKSELGPDAIILSNQKQTGKSDHYKRGKNGAQPGDSRADLVSKKGSQVHD